MVFFSTHLSTTSLKVNLQQFLSFSTSCPDIKEKMTSYIKQQEVQFEETANIRSRFRFSRAFEPSDQKFKTAMINMLKMLMDKVDITQGQMGHVNREMEILRKH